MNEADADSKVHDLAEALSALGKELLCPIWYDIGIEFDLVCVCWKILFVCLVIILFASRELEVFIRDRNCLEIYLFKKAICPICKKRQTKRVFAVSESLVTIITNYRTLAYPSALSVCT